MHSWIWTPEKDDQTFAARGIRFAFAVRIFEGDVLLERSDRDGEPRVQAIGKIEGRYFSVVYTKRFDPRHRRVISARRARKNEEENYRNRYE